MSQFWNALRELLRREPKALLYLALTLVGSAVFITSLRVQSDAPKVAVLPVPAESPADIAARERRLRQRFFEQAVTAQLTTTDEANRQAAERCLRRIGDNFARYRGGIDDFVQDITGIRSRLGILKRMPGGWWTGDGRVKEYIAQKFESHLFSEARLAQDLRTALEAFREEVRSNQQTLVSQTQAAINTSELPPLDLADYDTIFKLINEEIQELAGQEATTSVRDGLVALIVSEAGSTAAGMLVGRVVAGITASTASTLATAGGATAGGAAAGAAGGSVVPGAGTLVGFGIGLVVGVGIDYWLNEQTAQTLTQELSAYLDTIEANLMLGSSAASEPHAAGLSQGIHSACDQIRDGVHQRFYEIIVLEQTP